MPFAPLMRAIRANCLSAANVLVDLGYEFEFPPAVVDPEADRAETCSILAEAGATLPAALRAFYEIVGAVEFPGRAPSTWNGCKYSDPISVAPLDQQYWRNELEAWADQPDLDPDGMGRFMVQMSGDHIHKAGFSGGEYFILFDNDVDPTVLMHERRMPFTEYLRLCNAWGGFPGLQGSSGHTWPLEAIQANFVRLPD